MAELTRETRERRDAQDHLGCEYSRTPLSTVSSFSTRNLNSKVYVQGRGHLNVLSYRYRIILVFKILLEVQSNSFAVGHNTVPERSKTHVFMELINV